jgi:hypothetical protein
MDSVAKTAWKERLTAGNVQTIDKRRYIRFSANESNNPLNIVNNTPITKIVDISRGGMAVEHNRALKKGEVLPVQITYKNLDITANVKVLTATKTMAHTQFINLDSATANKLLYLHQSLEKEVSARATLNNNLSYGK